MYKIIIQSQTELEMALLIEHFKSITQINIWWWSIFSALWLHTKKRHFAWCNGLKTRPTNPYQWIWVSLGAQPIQPDATTKQSLVNNNIQT